jgi:hypothetical protein
MKIKPGAKLPKTVHVEIRNHTEADWMYLPWCGMYVPPDTRASVPVQVEWRRPGDGAVTDIRPEP